MTTLEHSPLHTAAIVALEVATFGARVTLATLTAASLAARSQVFYREYAYDTLIGLLVVARACP